MLRVAVPLAVRRLLLGLPLVAVVVTLTFFLIRLAPGDPAMVLAGDAPTPEFLASIRTEYGFDRPLPAQFLAFAAKAVQGDFGQSVYFHRPVFHVILDRLPATLLLTGSALLIAAAAGTLGGVMAARWAGRPADTAISAISLLGYSVPGFWIGQLLILLFAVQLGWLPSGGMTAARQAYTGWAHVLDLLQHLVLPVATLSVFITTMIARFTRAAMIEAVGQDFMLVAAAKGIGPRRLLWHHAFRNAAVTTVTVIGLETGAVLAGAVVTEIVFGWPGLGRLFYDAIFRRDYPLLTGSFMFSAFLVIGVNMVSDIVCALLDPRLR